MNTYRAGIDIGSTTVKLVLLDENGEILFGQYRRHCAHTQQTLKELLSEAREQVGSCLLQVKITGSGSINLGKAMGIGRDDPAFLALRTEVLDNYAAHMTDRSRPFEGVPVMLEALRAAGIRTGVVTNKVEHLALRLTDNLGLDGQLDVVLGSDSEGCAMKPAPDSLLTAARLTGVHVTDILYAGDDPRDVAAAHAAGMPCAACTWGYAVTPPESWGADLVAHSPAELATWAVQLNAHAL